MSDLAKAGLTQVIDASDKVADAAITALEETINVGVATGQATLNIGGKSLTTALEEVRALKAKLRASLQAIADSVSDAIPTP